MPGIPAITRGTFHNQFKCIYLKNQKHFVNIVLDIENLQKFLNISKKKLIQ